MQTRGHLVPLALVAVAIAGALTSEARAGGDPPAKAGASGHWKRIWADSFDRPAGSPANPRKWRYATGGWGWGNGQLQTNTSEPANVRHDGSGNLRITARRQTYTGTDGITRQYTSGRLKTQDIFAFRYGRVASRIRVAAGQGIHPAFWMLGNDIRRVGHPRCGEIDVMEVRGQEPRINYGTVHGPGPDGETPIGPGGMLEHRRSLAKRFHVYEARWSPGAVRFLFDGRRYAVVKRRWYPRDARWVYDHRMFLMLSLAVGGSWTGNPDATTEFPARMKIDWVRVWQRRG